MQIATGSDLQAKSPPIVAGRITSAGGRILKIQRCVLAQDGHSTGEQAVYLALWNEGQAEDGLPQEDSRTVSLGLDRIGKLTRIHRSNVRNNLQALIEKKSIELTGREVCDTRQGRTYRVFSYRRILQNRRDAGLLWVLKSKGVNFVDPEKLGIPAAELALLEEGITLPDGHNTTGSKTLPDTGSYMPRLSGSDMLGPSLLDFKPLEKPLGNTSSVVSEVLLTRAREVLSQIDDDAVQALWLRCRERAPDCTADEVVHFLRLKSEQLLHRGKPVKNPVGLMLESVPKCFEGSQPLYRLLRREKSAAAGQQISAELELASQRQEFERLADDPNTSEEDRKWYKTLLQTI